jgi:hypothetical protein
VNPNVLGFEFAEWLARELALRACPTSYPSNEDWGWYLEECRDQQEHLVCCGGEKTEAGVYEWHVFVTQPRRLFRRPPPTSRSRELESLIHKVLTDAGFAVTEDVEA